MIKKTVMGVYGLVFAAALSLPAFADQSIGFQEYFSEGVKAFKKHNDQKALRYFKIAQIYDPADKELKKYLFILSQKGVVLEVIPSQLPAQESIGYKYYLNAGIKAFRIHDNKNALRYFKIAKIFYPGSKEVDGYLEILRQPYAPQAAGQPSAPVQPLPIQPQPSAAVPQPPLLYVPLQRAKGPLQVISLTTIAKNAPLKPRLQIEYHSSVIIEGKNIQRFLAVDEGFIQGKIIDPDRLQIDALKIGTTFLHVWDNSGRYTFYGEVVFPKYIPPGASQAVNNGVQHSQPFIFTYANNWDTYYSGKNIPNLKRQSYEFSQSLGVTGETPYGFFDAWGSYIDFNSFTQFNTYTIGLSQIPLAGTSNFNLRGFDATRYLSPLTMPGTRLRGAFADVDLMGDTLGLSVSHGQEQAPLGFLTVNEVQFNNSYIDAVKLILFPKSNTDQFSFNYATGYGPDRQPYLSNHVYSLEVHHRLNDFFTLNAEQGSDSSHQSSLASLNWRQGTFRSALSFRDIDRNYATVSTLPANQGEIGAAWSTNGDFKNFTEDTFIEAYRDRLNPNPNKPNAFNVDANGQLRANLTPHTWSDSYFNYVNMAGEPSPTNSFGLNERLSRSFGIWRSLKGTVFAGAGYQNSHSSGSSAFDYDREDVVAGIQLPLTSHISTYANYEYDWLKQPDFGITNPTVINAGLQYQKQFSPKLSFNTQIDYRNELGIKAGNNTFLSGEESVIITSGFNYTPTPDVNLFADGSASKVLFHTNNPSYDDVEVHLGVRITFGGATYWDPLGTVSGIVFKDRNGDGKFTAGDQGIPGVKIRIGDKEATTDQDGRFRLHIRAKKVDVSPVLDTIPGGLLFSTPQTLNVRIFQGRVTKADFGLISQTGIYGIVFVSKNGSNVPHAGDQFVGKVVVILDNKMKQRSDLHGAFYFRNVSPGEHTMTIDINSLELNMVPLVKLENKINVTEGTNYMFNIPLKFQAAQSEEK